MAFVCSCQVASELLRAVERAGEDIGHTERLRALTLAKRSEIPHSDVSSEGGGRARTCLPWRPPLFPKASRFLGTSKAERPQLAGVDQVEERAGTREGQGQGSCAPETSLPAAGPAHTSVLGLSCARGSPLGIQRPSVPQPREASPPNFLRALVASVTAATFLALR